MMLLMLLSLFCVGAIQAHVQGYTPCTKQSDCSDNLACRNHQCVDLCRRHYSCGPNTDCKVINHELVCRCKPGFVGDELAGCVSGDSESEDLGNSINHWDALLEERNSSHALGQGKARIQKRDINLIGCSPGVSCWPPADSAGKTKRFHISEDQVNWMEAFHRCRHSGQRLASVNSVEENEALLKFLIETPGTNVFDDYTYGHWMGGTDVLCEDDWRWLSTGKKVDLTILKFIDEGYPNNAGGVEHCFEVARQRRGKTTLWNDDHCLKKKKYICEDYI